MRFRAKTFRLGRYRLSIALWATERITASNIATNSVTSSTIRGEAVGTAVITRIRAT